MNFRRHSQLPPVHLALINFIDILLVLTVFLMSNIALAPNEKTLDVTLPKTNSSAPEVPKRPTLLVVNVSREGAIIVNGRTYTPPELEAMLGKLKGVQPDTVIVLRADQQAPYQTILGIIDVCGNLKLNQISFAAARK